MLCVTCAVCDMRVVHADNVQSALWDIPHLDEGLEIIKKMDPNIPEAVKLIAGTCV